MIILQPGKSAAGGRFDENNVGVTKMIKALITLSAILLATAAAAQQNFACQYTASNGFSFSEGQWGKTAFTVGPPFFIKLGSNTLDPQSIYDGLNLGYASNLPTCFSKDVFQGSYYCASHIGETVTFNPETGQGARATVYGAGSSTSGRRDTLSIDLFVCQKF